MKSANQFGMVPKYIEHGLHFFIWVGYLWQVPMTSSASKIAATFFHHFWQCQGTHPLLLRISSAATVKVSAQVLGLSSSYYKAPSTKV